MTDRPSSRLIRTIEGEIVPRLLLSTASAVTAGAVTAGAVMAGGDGGELNPVDKFARLLLGDRDGNGAIAFLRRCYPPGTTARRIYLDLMAPAARRLGELWERDECDFDELIAGLSRIETLLRKVGASLG